LARRETETLHPQEIRAELVRQSDFEQYDKLAVLGGSRRIRRPGCAFDHIIAGKAQTFDSWFSTRAILLSP
jgi:hypothetical protein